MDKLSILENRVQKLEDDLFNLQYEKLDLPSIGETPTKYEVELRNLVAEMHIEMYRFIREYAVNNKLVTEDGYVVDRKVNEFFEKIYEVM